MFGPTRVLQNNSEKLSCMRWLCVVLFCAYMRSRPELKAAQRWACMDCHLSGLVSALLSLARSSLNIRTNTHRHNVNFNYIKTLKKQFTQKIWILSPFTNPYTMSLVTLFYAITIKGTIEVETIDLIKNHYFDAILFSESLIHFTKMIEWLLV